MNQINSQEPRPNIPSNNNRFAIDYGKGQLSKQKRLNPEKRHNLSLKVCVYIIIYIVNKKWKTLINVLYLKYINWTIKIKMNVLMTVCATKS